MSANLYDLLDVDEAAGTDEIRAAYRAAVADLDPTDRRFRAFTSAAEVLLDDARRADYDAELSAARQAEEPDDEPVEDAPAEDAPADSAPVVLTKSEPVEPVLEQPSAPSAARSGPTTVALIAAAVAAVLSLGFAIWIATLDGVRADMSPKETARLSAAQDRAALDAEGAAERLVPIVLSYDYRTMAQALEGMKDHLTDDMAAKQAKAWPTLTEQAETLKVVVDAQARGTALTRIDSSGERATVVVYIDQDVQRSDVKPFTLQMWATMTLVHDEKSGEWLVDDLCTNDTACS